MLRNDLKQVETPSGVAFSGTIEGKRAFIVGYNTLAEVIDACNKETLVFSKYLPARYLTSDGTITGTKLTRKGANGVETVIQNLDGTPVLGQEGMLFVKPVMESTKEGDSKLANLVIKSQNRTASADATAAFRKNLEAQLAAAKASVENAAGAFAGVGA